MIKNGKVYCDDCNYYLGGAESPIDWDGVNPGEHECDDCKREREKSYDIYHDPYAMHREITMD